MILAIISAILLILSFPSFNLSFLAFIGFAPLFFAIKNKSPRKAFFIFFLCGFLFYLGALYWLYHVTTFGLIVLCLYLALYFGIFGFLCASSLLQRSMISIPFIWIILESIQSHLFTGFGWALLGYSQYENLPLIQIADFSGVYGVSFVIMLVNVAVYRAFQRSFRSSVVAFLVLVMVFGYGAEKLKNRGEEENIKISVIQGNIPQNVKWDPDATDFIMDRFTDLSRTAALDDPSLIVWPETSFPGFFESDRELTKEVLDLSRELGIPFLIGANTENGIDIFNSAVLISEKGEIVDKYDKIHLVPFGEYVPFSDRIPVLRDLVLGEFGEFTKGEEYKVFSLKRKFATLICFEDIFPEMSRKFVQNGAEFLIVITNDAWYGKSGAPYQHAACSVFRAIENRVPVVRSANTGYSCFIDSSGRIFDAVEKDNSNLFITGHKASIVTLR